MIYMAFVGPKEFCDKAQQTFLKPPEVNEIKHFPSTHSFLVEVRRENSLLHSAYICIPDCDIDEVKATVAQYERNAQIVKFDASAIM